MNVNLVKGTASGQGRDTLHNIQNVTGSALNDTITDNAADNVIDGGAGTDVVRFDGIAAAVTVDLSNDIATGQGNDTLINVENVVGSSLADSITGDAGNNRLDGGGGADTLQGLGGNDTYVVDNTADVVLEAPNAGNDTVLTTVSYTLGVGQSIESLRTTNNAGTTAINLTGNELAQAIVGNAGPNFINGGGGNDVLSGLGGADTFVFNTPLSATGNVDRITDFDPTADKIQLAKTIFTALKAGALPASAFFIGTAAHDADDRIIYNATTGALTYDSNGNAAGGATQFATLKPGLAVVASDFTVV